MTSRSNLNTLRQLFTWNSTWYNTNSYKQLLFRDLVIEVYLTSLFYKLRIPTSYFLIKNIYFEFYIIESDLYILKKRKLAYIFLNYTKLFSWMHKIFYFYKSYSNSLQLNNVRTFFLQLSNYSHILNICSILLLSSMRKAVLLQNFVSSRLATSTTNLLLVKHAVSIKSNFLFITKNSAFSRKSSSYALYKTKSIDYQLIHFFIYYTRTLVLNSSLNSYTGLSSWLDNWSSLAQYLFRASTPNHSLSYNSLRFLFSELSKATLSNDYLYKFWTLKKFIVLMQSAQKKTLFTSLTSKLLKLKNLFKSIDSLCFVTLTYKFKNRLMTQHGTKSNLLFNVFFKRVFNNHKKKINIFFFYDYYFKLFNILSNRIEHSIRLYTDIQFFFYPTIFFNNKPFIKNSKLICEYITMSLENGLSINNVWKNIKLWIEDQQTFLDRIESGSLKRRILGLSRNPLKGIRIICRGPNYKARRKRKFIFHSWVSNNLITGKMPTQSFDTQIDFFQSFAIMKQATIGVRVWTLFEFIRKT